VPIPTLPKLLYTFPPFSVQELLTGSPLGGGQLVIVSPLRMKAVAFTVPATSNFCVGLIVPMPTLPESKYILLLSAFHFESELIISFQSVILYPLSIKPSASISPCIVNFPGSLLSNTLIFPLSS